MDTPKVSVIVPVYQAERYLEECLQSILGQTFSDFELLLINDGSTDKSGLICDHFAKKDNRIMVIHKENEGVGAARNTGLEHCRGEYITFVDSDDTVDTRFLEFAVESLSAVQTDLFISGVQMETWKNGAVVKSTWYGIETSRCYSIKELLENMMKTYPQICICGPWCKLYKRTIVETHHIRFSRYFNYGEDTYFNLDYFQHCKSVLFSQECFYHYRRDNGESLFSRFHKDTYEVHKLVYSKMRFLMQQVHCSEIVMQRYEALYFSLLLGGIHEYYRFYEKTTAKERLQQIIKVGSDPNIPKVRVQYISNRKHRLIFVLLNLRMYWLVAILFEFKYYIAKSIYEHKESC